MGGICHKYIKSTIRMKKLSLSSNCITINIEIWATCYAQHFRILLSKLDEPGLIGRGCGHYKPFVILSNPEIAILHIELMVTILATNHRMTVIHYKTCGAVCIQLAHFPCDDSENTYTLSYYHHRIGSMNYYPLFRVRSWNNGVRCMSFCILSDNVIAIHTSQWQYRGILWHVAHKILLCIVCIY